MLTQIDLGFRKFRLSHKLAEPTGSIGLLIDGCAEPVEQASIRVAVDVAGTQLSGHFATRFCKKEEPVGFYGLDDSLMPA